MKSTKVNYFVVGLFVIAMVSGLVVTIAVLTGRTGATDTYFTRYADVSGLKYGTKVLYMGYPVGQVEDIEPRRADGRLSFVVKMSVISGWRIPADSVARIKASGLLAALTIDIHAGHSRRQLAPGSFIKGEQQSDMFSAVSDTANALKQLTETTLRPLLQNLNHSVQVISGLLDHDAGGMVHDLRVLAGELAQRAPEIIDNFLSLSREVKATSERLRALIGPRNAARVNQVADNLATASQQLVVLTRRTREQLDALLGKHTQARVKRTLDNVSAASDDLATFSRDANKRLAQVMGPDTVRKLRRALDSVARAGNDIASLSADLRGTGKRLEHFVNTLNATVDQTRPGVTQSVADLRYSLRAVAEHIDAVADSLEGTSRNMSEFSRELRDNPALLLRGRRTSDPAGTRTAPASTENGNAQ